GNHCANLLIQNREAILSHMERWKDSLYQLAYEEKISPFIPKNLEKSVLRLFEPLPEAFAKEIEGQKSIIHKNREIPLALLKIIADYYGNQQDFNRAISYATTFLKLLIQKLSEMSQNKEVLVSIMQTHENLATLYQLFGDCPMAIFHSEKALKIARELDDPYAIFIYLTNIGKLYLELGEGGQALPFYEKAQAIAKTLQDPKSESLALVGLANAYLVINNNIEAIRCYQNALNLTENKSEKAWIYIGIGRAHANAQRYQPAEEAYQKALEILPKNDFLNAIKIYGKLTNFFNDFGRYEKAISYAEKTLELTQHLSSVQVNELDIFVSKFSALKVLGSIYGAFGDYEREVDYQMQALEIAEKIPLSKDDLVTALINLGNAYCNKRDYPKSIKCYAKALKITENVNARATILINMANLLYEKGHFAKALELYEEANKIGNQEIKTNSLIGLGLCYDATGKEQAIQNIENFICLSQESEDRRNQAVGYHYLGELYGKSNLKLAEENYRKSIDIFAALHQELKNHSHWQITFFEEQAISLLKLEKLLLKQDKTEEALQITDFRRSRALVSALSKKFQFQKDDLLSSSGLTIQEMQALANKLNTCLIVYSFASESTNSITVWIIPSQGKIICQQLPLGILIEEFKAAKQVFKTFPFIAETRTIETPLESFLEELTRGELNGGTHPSNSQAFKKRLSLWYEALVAPLEDYLPKDHQQVVTIIPDNFLAQIPFAAFLDKEGKYFIEKHPISIAPSIEILKLLNEIPKDFSESSLVIGNPTTPYPKEELEFAEKEAQTIVAPFLKTTPEKTLLQDNATVERAIDGMLDARWIHLACHGSIGAKPEEKLDLHSVFEGLFKLAPDEIHPKGYLHAQEIAALTLHSELVFMS
uniref:CHAT domain-containing protein n=1 Tax=Candidatus Protochlamydia sp. W-9 TaxID=1785087 RepID=UPI00096A3826